MLKRANKVTALVVAAASVMTLVPAMATERLGTKDGHVNEAVAFDGGKYAYYGFRTDDDDTGIWYNKGDKSDKDKQIDDLEDYELATDSVKYGEKYAYVTEEGNDDEYLVDLTTGEIADEDTPEDEQASAQAKTVSALKKAERYNETQDIQASDVETQRLFQNQFGEIWYQYVTSSSSAEFTTTGAAVTTSGYFADGRYTGFTNTSGKYIDASYLANMKIYNPRKDKATVIEQFNKLYKDEALKVNLLALQPLAQDKDYIYALATVDVNYYGKDANGDYDFTEGTETTSRQYFIQKISKERDTEKEDGAYLPKSVESWQIDNETMFDGTDDDSDVAYNAILGTIDGQVGNSKYAVKDGTLYVTLLTDSGDKVHVYKLKLGKDKRDVVDTTLLTSNLSNETDLTDLGKDTDMTIVTVSEDDDTDVDAEFGSVSIDVDGNTWAISDGEISMFDDEWKTQFKCDQSFDRLDVYNKDSLIAWEDDEDNDTYTTVQEGKTQTVDDAKVVDPNLIDKTTVKTGWVQNGTAWTFFDATGAQVKGNWVNEKGVWYYLNADGNMATGWVQVAGTWYYLNTSGAMQTGWVNAGGTWYYLKSSGAMATGWLNDSGTWYYLNASGAMLANTTVDGYTLGANGAWIQ